MNFDLKPIFTTIAMFFVIIFLSVFLEQDIFSKIKQRL